MFGALLVIQPINVHRIPRAQALLRCALALADADNHATEGDGASRASALLTAAPSILEHADWLYSWLLRLHEKSAAPPEDDAARLMHAIAAAVREYGQGNRRTAGCATPHDVAERFAARAQQLTAKRHVANEDGAVDDDDEDEL